jgi:CBS domain-containing protein
MQSCTDLGGSDTPVIIKSIEQIIAQRTLPSISPDASVREACLRLTELNVGALVVLSDDKLVGVISERDVIRKCICQSRPTTETAVSQIMTPDPVTIGIVDGLPTALAFMSKGGFRHLPVLNNGKPVGLLSIRDIPTEYHLMFERFLEAKNVSPASGPFLFGSHAAPAERSST